VNLLTALLLTTRSKSPSPAPRTPDPDTVNAGWLGFIALLFLSIAVFFLWKSMNNQLTRVTFDEVPVDPEPGDGVPGAVRPGDAVPVAGPVDGPTSDPSDADGPAPTTA
jgi:hypothetical protein